MRDLAALFIDTAEYAAADDGVVTAPTAFRLFRYGLNASTKGSFLFDEEAAANVMSAWRASGIAMMGDYEHQSLYKDPPIEAPASCTECQLEIRNGGELWATGCKWTDRAAGMLGAREYRYFSPAFYFDTETSRVLELINFALTNVPSLRAIKPLVKATAIPTEDSMEPEKQIAALTATNKALEAEVASLKATAVSGGELAQLNAMKLELLAATGAKTPAEALGKIENLKERADKADELKVELAKREQKELVAKLDAILNSASTGEKPVITPAKRDELRKRSLNAAGEVVPERLEFLTGLLGDLEPLAIKTTTAVNKGDGPAADDKRVALSDIEIPADTHKFLAHLKATPDDIRAYKADPAKWLADQEAKRKPAARTTAAGA